MSYSKSCFVYQLGPANNQHGITKCFNQQPCSGKGGWQRENESVDNVLVIKVERWKSWWVKQMDRWMKCVLWALARSFEECRIKDVQLTRVKHERFWRIVSHDFCHTKQTLWYSNLIHSLICCSQSRTLQNYGGWSRSFSPGFVRESNMLILICYLTFPFVSSWPERWAADWWTGIECITYPILGSNYSN